jgi:hypothetical protein
MAVCRHCGAAVIWTSTRPGESAALDADPHPDGAVTLAVGGAIVLPPEVVEWGRRIGSTRYRVHACPAAKRNPKGVV